MFQFPGAACFNHHVPSHCLYLRRIYHPPGGKRTCGNAVLRHEFILKSFAGGMRIIPSRTDRPSTLSPILIVSSLFTFNKAFPAPRGQRRPRACQYGMGNHSTCLDVARHARTNPSDLRSVCSKGGAAHQLRADRVVADALRFCDEVALYIVATIAPPRTPPIDGILSQSSQPPRETCEGAFVSPPKSTAPFSCGCCSHGPAPRGTGHALKKKGYGGAAYREVARPASISSRR